MALAAGTRLGPYEIQSLLGAGGMGEVYKARDTRLDRAVAVKICHEKVADRFAREARAVAALNHPNIVALFDVGENYFVTELIEGESLRNARLSTRRAIEVAAQVAEGLAAAHAVGISHRDIKPDNVMLTRDGRAKILDFGIARRSTPGPADATQTEPGAVMGTVGYMSPEQVRGQEADSRSDIFSFGAMLHEMLSGKRAFTGETAAEVMTAILKSDPAELPLSVPGQCREIVRRCLEKDPSARFQSAKDLSFVLKSSLAASETAAVLPVAKTRRSRLPYFVAAAGVVAAFAAGWAIERRQPLDLTDYRLTPIASETAPERMPAWSPDGKSIAYSAPPAAGGRAQIFVRRLDAVSPDQITHEEAACSRPFWSPKGDRIFFSRGPRQGPPEGLSSVAAIGGAAEKVLDNYAITAIAPDGVAMAVARRNELSFGKLGGKEWTPLKSPPFDRDFSIFRMRFSPDAKHLAIQYASINTGQAGELWLVPHPPGSGAARRLFAGDSASRSVGGFDWMPDSRNLAVAIADGEHSEIFVGDSETGALRKLTSGVQRAAFPSVSPDGRRIAFENDGSDSDLVEIPLDGFSVKPLLATARSEFRGAWLPNGREFAYVSDAGGSSEPWIRNAEDGRARPLLERIGEQLPGMEVREFALSPDGDRLALNANGSEHVIWALRVKGGKPVRLDPENPDHHHPAWSPDGNWIAYGRVRPETQLMKVPSGGATPVVIADGNRDGPQPVAWSPTGQWIAWTGGPLTLYSPDGKERKKLEPAGSQWEYLAFSRDGKQLFAFRQPRSEVLIQAFDIATGAGRQIAVIPLERFTSLGDFSLHPDGKRFIATLTRNRADIVMLEGF